MKITSLWRLLLTVGVVLTSTLGLTGVAMANVPTKVACSQGGACKIGDKGPGGGVVFLIRTSPGNGTGKNFEAAPEFRDSQAKYSKIWCSNADDVAGAKGEGIGDGPANTDAIIAIPGCATNSAAALARAYRGGGKADWFLPSSGELLALAKRDSRKQAHGTGPFWSSTQDWVPANAKSVCFGLCFDGTTGGAPKTWVWGDVIAVRVF